MRIDIMEGCYMRKVVEYIKNSVKESLKSFLRLGLHIMFPIGDMADYLLGEGDYLEEEAN